MDHLADQLWPILADTHALAKEWDGELFTKYFKAKVRDGELVTKYFKVNVRDGDLFTRYLKAKVRHFWTIWLINCGPSLWTRMP
jgi:hypothetical protein